MLYNKHTMATVNISLPDKLKEQADSLVKAGYYASLSDLIRDGARSVIRRQDLLDDLDRSQQEFSTGKGKVLHSLKNMH